jgi:NAD(P)-dependent dehydrogenase (short-subunit alcohol dehydrogenase family)
MKAALNGRSWRSPAARVQSVWATAKAFAAAGAKVAIGDLDADLAKRVAADIHGDVVALPLDVTTSRISSACAGRR